MADPGRTVKTKMSFTDLVPGVNWKSQGITDPQKALADLLNPFSSNLAGWKKAFAVFESIDFLVTLITNPVISLFINPQSITVTKNVLLDKQTTKGGFVVQFWGHDLETISVKAETGYFGLSAAPVQAFNLFKDYCYQGRYNPRKPFKAAPIITMLYEGQALRGYFNNLTYTIVQSRPYIIQYDFTFTVTELVSVPILASIGRIVSKFDKPFYTPNDIRNQVDIAKGWGTKLY